LEGKPWPRRIGRRRGARSEFRAKPTMKTDEDDETMVTRV
jgi:hypothetical protein